MLIEDAQHKIFQRTRKIQTKTVFDMFLKVKVMNSPEESCFLPNLEIVQPQHTLNSEPLGGGKAVVAMLFMVYQLPQASGNRTSVHRGTFFWSARMEWIFWFFFKRVRCKLRKVEHTQQCQCLIYLAYGKKRLRSLPYLLSYINYVYIIFSRLQWK